MNSASLNSLIVVVLGKSDILIRFALDDVTADDEAESLLMLAVPDCEVGGSTLEGTWMDGGRIDGGRMDGERMGGGRIDDGRMDGGWTGETGCAGITIAEDGCQYEKL